MAWLWCTGDGTWHATVSIAGLDFCGTANPRSTTAQLVKGIDTILADLASKLGTSVDRHDLRARGQAAGEAMASLPFVAVVTQFGNLTSPTNTAN